MSNAPKLASLITLGLVIVPCLAYFVGAVSIEAVKWTSLAGTIGWFIATPMWMSRDSTTASDSRAGATEVES